MWTRKELKDRAKQVLRTNYWKAFLVSLVIAFASGGGGNGGRNSNSSVNHFFEEKLYLNMTFWLIVAGIILFAIALRVFVCYPLEVGGRKYFIQSAQYADNSKCFRFAFRGENYMPIALTMLLRDVLIFLWSLLLIIPGIIKAYAYSMVPYILADNPNIGCREAIRLSNQMTRGHKLDMFVLDLSFLGWYLLGVLALGIGVFFVMPYDNATKAELYLILRHFGTDSDYTRTSADY